MPEEYRDEENITIAFVDEDGKLNTIEAEIKDNVAEIKNGKPGDYAIIADAQDNNTLYYIFALLGAAIIAVVAILVFKKKKGR